MKRVRGLDFLRILSALCVVLIHVNALFLEEMLNEKESGYYFFVGMVNIITRFSVPCFVMISGAFNIGEKSCDFKKFYSKTFKKIVVPYIVIAVALLLINEMAIVFGMRNEKIWLPLERFFRGEFLNFWYVHMLIGLYAITPILSRIKRDLTNKCWTRIAIVFMLWVIISQFYSSYTCSYSVGVVFSYLGYYLIGNSLYDNKEKLPKMKLIVVILLLIGVCLVSYEVRAYYKPLDDLNAYTSFFYPSVVLISCIVFTYFLKKDINETYVRFSKYMYYVYLFHTPIYIFLVPLTKKLPMQIPIQIVIASIITFLISLVGGVIFSVIENSVWKLIDQRRRI